MAFDAGLSFQPGTSIDRAQTAGGDAGMSNRGASPVQDAIRVLSLKIPKMVGQGSPINPSLLGGGPGFGPGGPQDFLQLLQKFLAGASGQPGMQAPQAMPQAPTPAFTMGVTTGGQAPPPPPTGYQTNFDTQAPTFGGPSVNQPIGGLKGATGFTKPSFQLWGS